MSKRNAGCLLAAASMDLPASCDPLPHAHKRMCCGPSSLLHPHQLQHPPTHPSHLNAPSSSWAASPAPSLPPHLPLAPFQRLSPEVQGFLHKLARTHLHTSLHTALPESSFGDAVWQCLGELNLDMEAHFPSLPARSIRGYHSFTRMPRDMLQQRYTQQQQGQQQGQGQQGAHLWSPPPPLTLQAQMVLFILDKVFAQYPEAAVVQYTLEVQPWLLPWCQRWGLVSHASPDGVPLVHITAVHSYAQPAAMAAPGAPAELPIRALYVPSFQH